MKIKHILPLLLAITAVTFSAERTFARESTDGENFVKKANYELAARFSTKRINQMVGSTRVRPHWFSNSDKFWYSWKDTEGTKYYIVNPANGSKEEIFDMDKLAMELTLIMKDPFDAKHIPMKNLKLKDDKFFTFDVVSSQFEEPKKSEDKDAKEKKAKHPKKKVFHFSYDYKTGKLEDVSAEYKDCNYPYWASVSPDGMKGVYIKNHNLYWMSKEDLYKANKDAKDSTIVENAITTDGTINFSYNTDNYKGDTDTSKTKRTYPYGVRWSPNSKHFAAIKWDMSMVKDFWVIHSTSQPRPTLETYKYQMPGEAGPIGYLYIYNMEDGTRKYIPTHTFKDQDIVFPAAELTAKEINRNYYTRKWIGDNKGFYITKLSRDLKRTDLCYVGIDADSTKTIIPERENTYIEYRNPYLIDNGKKIIHWSERNGWANLYLYDSEGNMIRNLTEGAFHVEDVLGVNEKEGYVIFNACGVDKNENPYNMHTYRVGLTGEGMRKLDMDDMDVLSYCSDDAKYIIANYSRVDYTPSVAIFDAKGKKTSDLEVADFSELFAAGYKFPERFKVKAADGITNLYGVMYKPFDFDSTKVYPICDYVYPGPQVEANNISWHRGFTRIDRLAQVGFIVITVGNRGGHPNRSKWYHNYGYGNLRDYGLEDQKYAVQQLAARHKFIDINRVGIHGHSGGGFMSTAAMLKYPDFFKAAVSCSGNHDNTIYNRWWSEQHHGILEKINAGDTTFVYHINTNQELAKNLKGHLMLCTGDIDDNVNPANTIRVIDALIKANKRFEYLLLPGQRHGYITMNEYFFWRMADFYSRHLLGDDRPLPVDITEMNNN